ncbi:unnamed protein product [Prorocentrum cordatum]|uniref:Uncharacterized protein n=1 Tax=Prorocentrum cordatum TaxID=2364126 RepID=A0ABN9UD69_9DINO|nr:unnamed protein product [Polarella glacialis]
MDSEHPTRGLSGGEEERLAARGGGIAVSGGQTGEKVGEGGQDGASWAEFSDESEPPGVSGTSDPEGAAGGRARGRVCSWGPRSRSAAPPGQRPRPRPQARIRGLLNSLGVQWISDLLDSLGVQWIGDLANSLGVLWTSDALDSLGVLWIVDHLDSLGVLWIVVCEAREGGP